MAEDWTPFGFTDEEQAEYQVLVPGVPRWLLEPLMQWLRKQLLDGNWAHSAVCLEVQTVARIDLGVRAGELRHETDLMGTIRALDALRFLRLVDFLVASSATLSSAPVQQLAAVLDAGRSKWTVGERQGKPGLVERVPEGVQAAVEGAIGSGGSAGRVLARAWSSVHGLQPNDSSAYADAVRAVEIAAIDVVQRNHSTATLGTVLGQMRADGDWRLPLREHAEAPSHELVLAMGRTLWHGHRDRHGSVDYSDVSHEEARAAVSLAATLVEWFTSGAIARRPA